MAIGITVLITGVPGVGKTALMDRLRAQWSDPKGKGPLGLRLDIEDLQGGERLAQAISEKLPGSAAEIGRSILASVRIGLGVASAGSGIKERAPSLHRLTRPVVLFIDEVQNVPPSRDAPAVEVLRILHSGTHGAPIVPVLAGLAHAEDVLDEVGISRLGSSSVLPLGTLSQDEAAVSAARFLDAFRIAGNRQPWPETIAGWSDGWPMHVHNGLRSLAKELAENGGDLDRIDPHAVKRQAMAFRTGYYRRRTHGAFEFHQGLLARVMEDIRETGSTASEIVGFLTSHGGDSPAGMTEDEAFRALQSGGLIQRLPVEFENLYACPIPSLASYCAAGTGSLLHRAVVAGNRDATAALLKAGHDPNGRDIRGRTPLHIAAEQYWPNLIEELIRAGADPKVLDNRGRAPEEVQLHDPILAPNRPMPAPAAPKPKPTPVDDRPEFGM